MALRIATNLHDMLFRSIDRAKMIFFNAYPSGRILNRFSKDMYRVDTSLPIILADVIDVSRFDIKCNAFTQKSLVLSIDAIFRFISLL